MTVTRVAREVGVSGESLGKWIKQDGLDRGERKDGLTTGERDELRRLRRESRDLVAQREILKRSACFECSKPSTPTTMFAITAPSSVIARIVATAWSGHIGNRAEDGCGLAPMSFRAALGSLRG